MYNHEFYGLDEVYVPLTAATRFMRSGRGKIYRSQNPHLFHRLDELNLGGLMLFHSSEEGEEFWDLAQCIRYDYIRGRVIPLEVWYKFQSYYREPSVEFSEKELNSRICRKLRGYFYAPRQEESEWE